VCDRGYRYASDLQGCMQCEIGFHKSFVGDNQSCFPCPEGQTTYSHGSMSNSSCFKLPTTSTGNGSTDATTTDDLPYVVSNASQVPAVEFELSLRDLPETDDPAQLQALLSQLVRRTLSDSARLDPGAIRIDFPVEGGNSDPAGSARRLSFASVRIPSGIDVRRLVDLTKIKVTIRARSVADAQQLMQEALKADTVTDEMVSAIRRHPTLAASNLAIVPSDTPTIGTSVVTCPRHRSVPPSVAVLSQSDCQCSPGYSYDSAGDICEPCAPGQYKPPVGNSFCTICPRLRTTREPGATSSRQCLCGFGTYLNEQKTDCLDCPVGFYCEEGVISRCPTNASSGARSFFRSDCFCVPGYFGTQGGLCAPCPSGQYKPNDGNGVCALTCPANAASQLASTELADCFCTPDTHAKLNSDGVLITCERCNYRGLECRGGFEADTRIHAQPIASEGYYQTAREMAAECIVTIGKTKACKGGSSCTGKRAGKPVGDECNGDFGNACLPGSRGVLCGMCPAGWARDGATDACVKCGGESTMALALSIVSDVTLKAGVDIVTAALAAMTAAKGGKKLHTSMLRLGTQWVAACSVITQFDLTRLPAFSWSVQQTQKRSDTCNSNSTGTCSTDNKADDGSFFRWPPEVSTFFTNFFSALSLVPKYSSVKMSSQCVAANLFPGSQDAKIVGPAIYYVTFPFLLAIDIIVLCAVLVYVVIPLVKMFGVDLNEDRKRRNQLMKAVGDVLPAVDCHLKERGICWDDVKLCTSVELLQLDWVAFAADPNDFIDSELLTKRPLAIKACMSKLMCAPELPKILTQDLVEEEHVSVPSLLCRGIPTAELSKLATGTDELSSREVQRFGNERSCLDSKTR